MLHGTVRFGVGLAIALCSIGANAADTASSQGWHPYVGVSAGTTSISTTVQMLDATQFSLDKSPATVGLFAGVRPSRHFGLELDYLDFAAVGVPFFLPATTGNNQYYKAESKAWSLGAFALGYVPLGKSPFELYGKLGGALVENRHKTLADYSGTQLCISNFALNTCVPVGVAATDTTKAHFDPAMGVGLQVRLGDFRLRLDLQHSFTLDLNPTTTTLGAAYSW